MAAVRIKVCGLTRREDVSQAVSGGADFIGLVFAPSPRQVGINDARELLSDLPGRVAKVALFMDQPEALVSSVTAAIGFDLLQFHGRENNQFCRQFDVPFIKAVPMAEPLAVQEQFLAFPDAEGLLLDSHAWGGAGGSGVVFDWGIVPHSTHRIWLAGGLNPQNVAHAIRQVRPWAVDVSSGVERAPGIKDHGLIKSFIDAARAAAAE